MKGLGRLKFALLVPLAALLTAVAASPMAGVPAGQVAVYVEAETPPSTALADNTWGP